MSSSTPRNIFLIVADSLRYDSVFFGDPGLPYAMSHGVSFTQARAAGCWTLPATAGLFTGLTPHEHGATAQTRGLRPDLPTLAELLHSAGYTTSQITANIATTEIFGLERGFEDMLRIWRQVPAHHKRIHQLMLLLGKPRLRRRLWSTDLVAGKLSEDIEAAKVWLQDTWREVFDQTRALLRRNEKRSLPGFYFLNLMDTHFPYHVGPLFETTSDGAIQRLAELRTLFHFINQTWLIDDGVRFSEQEIALLRRRQRLAWRRLAPEVDAFLRELHQEGDNLVIFCSDHGDALGEQGWLYHFSNVTDGGNRVPLIVLRPGSAEPRVIHEPVSARDLFHSILHEAGLATQGPHLIDAPERSVPYLESFWYNNQGRTLPKYRFNQNLLFVDKMRYLLRQGHWFSAAAQTDGPEPEFEALPLDANPLMDLDMDPVHRAFYLKAFEGHRVFCDGLST